MSTAIEQNGKATATVAVLTAEVRVLMVGSRQVTLSVYRQLDHRAPADIKPFGRVRDSQDRDPHTVYVVGQDMSGNLARSSTRTIVGRTVSDIEDLVEVGWRRHHSSMEGTMGVDGTKAMVDFVGAPKSDDRDLGDGWRFLSPEHHQLAIDEVRLDREQASAARARALAWRELPLIVLAGLR